jgi:TDG/mug DNA glycosylase family protein
MPRSLARSKRLPDRIRPRPRILFVGINPSLRSAEVGHHFAGPGNPFWRLLHAARLIPTALTYEDDARLPAHGLALTNIVSRATRSASELTRAEYTSGRARLARLITRVEPQTVAFVGVTVYRAFFGPGRETPADRCRAGVRAAEPEWPQRRLSRLPGQAHLVQATQALSCGPPSPRSGRALTGGGRSSTMPHRRARTWTRPPRRPRCRRTRRWLQRDPRCAVLISHADWWSGFLVFDPEALRLARRHIFSATTRRRSRDWDEYDRIAVADKRVAMVLRPDHVYGTALAKMREGLAK